MIEIKLSESDIDQTKLLLPVRYYTVDVFASSPPLPRHLRDDPLQLKIWPLLKGTVVVGCR
jgi:hypothetical protein